MRRARATRILNSIAANVRRLREARDLTQEQLAEAADLDVRQVQRIERASLNFGVVALVSLAEALDVSATRLLKFAELDPPRRGRPRQRPRDNNGQK